MIRWGSKGCKDYITYQRWGSVVHYMQPLRCVRAHNTAMYNSGVARESNDLVIDDIIIPSVELS